MGYQPEEEVFCVNCQHFKKKWFKVRCVRVTYRDPIFAQAICTFDKEIQDVRENHCKGDWYKTKVLPTYTHVGPK